MNSEKKTIGFRNAKIVTRLMWMSIITDILIILLLYAGYSTAQNMLTHPEPERLLRGYGIFTAIVFVILAIFLVVSNISLIRTIRLSFKELKASAEALAAGDVNVDLSYTTGYNDEFGQLADSFYDVAQTMQAQANVARIVASGDLTVDVEARSNVDALNIALREMVSKNKGAMIGINDAASQVNTAALEVSSASEALAQGSTQQASAIEEITVSIGDVAAKTKKNAAEANNAADLFLGALDNVNKGNAQMRDMMSAMNQINESSEKIGKIIKVIDDIAFQTNILALNAAVEAARAGEAGKGFAVVAEEVRNLAAKSAQAASETAELIEDSIAKVAVGSKIADDTAQALTTITEAVTESETIIRGIAEASNYQAGAIAQIDQAIEQVSQVVQTNSATSQQCAAASIELSNQASRMQELLMVYNLGTNASMKESAQIIKKREPRFEARTIATPVVAPKIEVTPVESEVEEDIIPTPTFSETMASSEFGSDEAEKIISLGDDLGKF